MFSKRVNTKSQITFVLVVVLGICSGRAGAADEEKTGNLLTFGPLKREAKGPGGLAVRSSLTTIFPEEAPDPESSPTISLSSAKHESESAQIVVIAGKDAVKVTGVEISELSLAGSSHTIASENIRAEFVGYASVVKSSYRSAKRTGLWPDVLMPMRAFEVPKGQCRLIWVTIYTPKNATAGDYVGTISVVYANGKKATVAVRLRVWNFAIPKVPALETSYWMSMGKIYEGGVANEAVARNLYDLFGAYRTSTDVYANTKYYRERNGEITVNFEQTKRNIEYAAGVAGFRTIEVGSGCWGASDFHGPYIDVYDRRTGKPLPKDERAKIKTNFMKLYLNEVCDFLEEKGWLDRAFLQLTDEPPRDKWNWILGSYKGARLVEPRIRTQTVVAIHPEIQGLFDIWVPHAAFYDRETYRQASRGISLYGKKNFSAKVAASSTGRGNRGTFYAYSPVDAYDGCAYTRWTPAEGPEVGKPQWLRFEFEKPQQIDGIRIAPYGSKKADISCKVEVSIDGKNFEPLALQQRDGMEHGWSFEQGEYKAVRLVYEKLKAPASVKWASGAREVEFLAKGLPLESTLARPKKQLPSEIWEYSTGAGYPSVAIDPPAPHEIRAAGWQKWTRGITGYLNWGGGNWWYMDIPDVKTLLTEVPPLIWPSTGNDNGGAYITWPAKDGPLASIRFARFRDGIDDYDYLTLLVQRDPDHPLLSKLRKAESTAYNSSQAIERNRRALATVLSE